MTIIKKFYIENLSHVQIHEIDLSIKSSAQTENAWFVEVELDRHGESSKCRYVIPDSQYNFSVPALRQTLDV